MRATYQVTARFGNIFEVVGKDEYEDKRDAMALVNVYRNTGRPVHLHKLIGNTSIVVAEYDCN